MRHFAVFIFLVFAAYLALFSGCKTGYHKEAGKWYWFSWTEAHGTTKKLVSEDANNFEKLSFLFAKDSDNVYYMYKKIEGADPETFELIGDEYYSKDKHHVYCNEVIVHGADPHTFRVLSLPYCRDKENVFNGSIRLRVDNVDDFEVCSKENANLISINLSTFNKSSWSKFLSRKIGEDERAYYGRGHASAADKKFVDYREITE